VSHVSVGPSYGAAAADASSYRQDALELAHRSGRMYVGLRGHVPDPKLFAYIPAELALRERVLPLIFEDGTLRVAVATAEPDLSLVRVRYPNLELELVCAPADEIQIALDQAVQR
jgi:MshEN domain